MAVLISTDRWAAWFQHPARQPMPLATIEGARLWRIMLVATAAAIFVFPRLLRRWLHDAPSGLSDPPGDRRRLPILLGILALGLLLRATRLTESLWYDEIAWYLSFGNGIASPLPIMGNYFDPVNHVLHTMLGWCSVHALEPLVGAELAFRMPALAFSLATIVIMEGLGRSVGGRRIGWLAALAAAAMPVAVLEGAESRGYSMMICLAALMTRLLLDARRRNTPAHWIAYAIICALGIWTHFVTACVPIGHAAWMTWRAVRCRTPEEWRQWRCGMAGLAFGAILTLTVLAPLLPDFLHQRSVFFSARGDEPTLFGTEGRHALLQLGGSWYGWAAIPGIVLVVFGTWRIAHRDRSADSQTTSMLRQAAACMLIGLPLMCLAVVLGGSWIYARFTLFALPGAMLLFAAGADRLWSRSPRWALIILLVTLAAWCADLRLRPPKQPLREAAMFVAERQNAGDRTLEIGLAHPVMLIYAGDLHLTYLLQHGKDLPKALAVDPELEPPEREAGLPRWVIVEYPGRVSPENYRLLEERGYRTVQRFNGWVDWTQGDIVVMERSF